MKNEKDLIDHYFQNFDEKGEIYQAHISGLDKILNYDYIKKEDTKNEFMFNQNESFNYSEEIIEEGTVEFFNESVWSFLGNIAKKSLAKLVKMGLEGLNDPETVKKLMDPQNLSKIKDLGKKMSLEDVKNLSSGEEIKSFLANLMESDPEKGKQLIEQLGDKLGIDFKKASPEGGDDKDKGQQKLVVASGTDEKISKSQQLNQLLQSNGVKGDRANWVKDELKRVIAIARKSQNEKQFYNRFKQSITARASNA